MKQFEFRLQKTMEWRQSQCESEKAELQRLHGRRLAISESRSAVRFERESLATDHPENESCSAEQLHREALFTKSLLNLERRLSCEEARCTSDIDRQVQRCVAADRAHRLLEKMRDAGRQRWLSDLGRELEATATETWNAVNGPAARVGRD